MVALYGTRPLPPGSLGPNAQALLEDIVAARCLERPVRPRRRTIEATLRDTTEFAYDTDLTRRALRRRTRSSSASRSTKAGFCQYYASTMAVFLRELDIPARFVQGFLPGQTDRCLRGHAHGPCARRPRLGRRPTSPATAGSTSTRPAAATGRRARPAAVRAAGRQRAAPSRRAVERWRRGPGLADAGGASTMEPGSGRLGHDADRRHPGRSSRSRCCWRSSSASIARRRLAARSARPGDARMAPTGRCRASRRGSGSGHGPTQTVYEYAGALADVLPMVRPELETVARAKVEVAYGGRVLADDRLADSARRTDGCASSCSGWRYASPPDGGAIRWRRLTGSREPSTPG